MAMERGVLRHRRPQVLQLGFLLVAREGDAALFPERDALLQGGVVERATTPQDHFKRALLGGRGPESLLIGLAHGLSHNYFARFRLSRYVRNARTISPLRERSFSRADCFMPSATSAGMRSRIPASSWR